MYEQTFPDNWEAYRHGGTPEEEIEGATILERMNNFLVRELEAEKWVYGADSKGEFKDLWNYLTALRGPDGISPSRGYSIKQNTTAVIRGKLNGFRDLASVVSADYTDTTNAVCMDCANEEGGHFWGHIDRAAKVVGLEFAACSYHSNKE